MDETLSKQNQIFEAYKPLRNRLSSLKLDESLFVIGNYLRYLTGEKIDFHSQNIEIDPIFSGMEPINKLTMVPPWQLELLVKGLIVNAQETSMILPKTLRKWPYFADTLNQLKDVEGKISSLYVNKNNVLLEFHRIAHRQFPWQAYDLNKGYFTRYYKIFSDNNIEKFVRSEVGLTIGEFYTIASVLWGFYIKKIAIDYPPKIEVEEINLDILNKFLDHFSQDYYELKDDFKNTQQFNERFAYSFNSLRKYPIIRMKYFGRDSLVCPDSTLLFWRFTDGLYYEISQKNAQDSLAKGAFGNSFGLSFQKYVGEVLEKSCHKIKFLGENTFGLKHEIKDSIDWILNDKDCAIFLECKAKRMQNESKVEILSDVALNEDLKWMANVLVHQVYKNIHYYRQGLYKHFPLDKNKKIFPMVVTLEDWFLFGDELTNRLDKFVKEALQKEGLPIEWLDEMPYTVCSIYTLERLTQVLDVTGICEVMSKKALSKEYRYWEFLPFLKKFFWEQLQQYKFPFEDDFKKILPIRSY